MTVKQDIDPLLPWYVTGKLDEEDVRRVDNYLAEHPEAAASLDVAREESTLTIQANEALGAPGGHVLGRILDEIAAEEAARPVPLLTRLTNWLPSFDMPTYQFAGGLAALIVILAQSVIIGQLLTAEPSGTGYETATGPEDASTLASPDLLIAFNERAPAGDVINLLAEAGLKIIAGPKGGGLFEVQFEDQTLQQSEKEKIAERLLKKTELVRFVSLTE